MKKKILLSFSSLIIILLILEIACYMFISKGYDLIALGFLNPYEDWGSAKIDNFNDYDKYFRSKDLEMSRLTSYLNEWGIERFRNIPYIKRSLFSSNYTPYHVLYAKYPHAPNAKIKATIRSISDNIIIYPQHSITIDSHARRTAFTQGKNSNIIMLGCSFIFGEGVSDHETTAYKLGQKLNTNTYNLGYNGSYASEALYNLNSQAIIHKGIPNHPTTIIYTFIDDHLSRIVGSSKKFQVDPQHYNRPFAYLKNDRIKINESGFSRPAMKLRWLYKLIGHSHIAKFLSIDLPVIKDRHMELIARIFLKMKAHAHQVHPNLDHFYISFFPGQKAFSGRLIPYLDKYKIGYFDFSDIRVENLLKGRAYFKHNDHPTAELHDLYAFLLSKELSRHL